MRFRDYLLLQEDEIVKTKRKGIIHLQDMKPVEALHFLRKIKNELGGVLSNIPITLKADGGSCRFGKDKSGKFFMETGNSGPIQSRKAFSTFNLNKGVPEVIMQRAMHYDDIYEHLEKATHLWKDLPNDTKVSCEVMYNPMATEDEDGLTFVSVKYDKDKLGKLMTLIPITVSISSSGDEHQSKEDVINHLLNNSTKDIKVVSPKLGHLHNLEVNALLEPLSAIDENGEQVLKSLKHADKPLKMEYQVILNAIKADLADAIMKHPIKGRDILGKNIEGYVLELEDGKLVKVTTPEFKQAKREEKQKKLNEDSSHLVMTSFLNDKSNHRYVAPPKELSRNFRTIVFEDNAAPLSPLSDDELPPFENTVHYGTINQLDVYLSGFYPNHHTFIIFDVHQKPLSFIVAQTKPEQIDNEERTKIVRTWTREDMQGKGYATSLYQFLIKKLELKLICDDMLSDKAVQMYKMFIAKKKFDDIFFYNEKTKQVQTEEPKNLWTFPNQWRICLESVSSTTQKPLFGHSGFRLLGELCFNNEGFM